jgi:hypothetical protein
MLRLDEAWGGKPRTSVAVAFASGFVTLRAQPGTFILSPYRTHSPMLTFPLPQQSKAIASEI